MAFRPNRFFQRKIHYTCQVCFQEPIRLKFTYPLEQSFKFWKAEKKIREKSEAHVQTRRKKPPLTSPSERFRESTTDAILNTIFKYNTYLTAEDTQKRHSWVANCGRN